MPNHFSFYWDPPYAGCDCRFYWMGGIFTQLQNSDVTYLISLKQCSVNDTCILFWKALWDPAGLTYLLLHRWHCVTDLGHYWLELEAGREYKATLLKVLLCEHQGKTPWLPAFLRKMAEMWAWKNVTIIPVFSVNGTELHAAVSSWHTMHDLKQGLTS